MLDLKKGDTVVVLGGKNAGKRGKIIRVLSEKGKVIVEGVQISKKHQRPTKDFPGGIIDKSLPIFRAKVALVCPRCTKPTRIGRKIISGRKVRVCKKCNEPVDKV